MVKLHVFGSSAGTEPQPGRHHTSWALEFDGKLYWFDAGESCYHTAVEMGLDLLDIRTLCISHPHIDHCGGLPNLLWAITKTMQVTSRNKLHPLELFLPDMNIFSGVTNWLSVSDKWKGFPYPLTPHRIADGMIFDDGNVSIEARHNFHLGVPEDGVFRSYSFRIKADGKVIVFSGDVKSYADMGDFLDGCDLLLMETGHHKSSEVCAALRKEQRQVKDIIFVHSGRELLNDYDNALARAESAWGAPLRVASDGSTFEL
ncbi:MAG: MBL fold metallo-hydrolase [Lentisphaeria bacterium]|nr:MBL fold metallo-hydrolase [Lentisphaeria bacterium]